MKELLSASPVVGTDLIVTPDPANVFVCPEESQFYSQCLELLVLQRCHPGATVVEFGCGEGSPVINALLRSPFSGTIHGYDLNASACDIAQSTITQYRLNPHYQIYNCSFFSFSHPQADYLIANPPYLPAEDNQIYMPLLHGGQDGAGITNQLLGLDYSQVLLMLSSYSNPVRTINLALAQGYDVVDFMVLPLQFGYYSSEPKVKIKILQLRQNRQAFFSPNIYLLAGVLFKKQAEENVNLSSELLRLITCL